ncbi:hypothetical protein ACOME3_003860 [Neoechinorhynchus agilis]
MEKRRKIRKTWHLKRKCHKSYKKEENKTEKVHMKVSTTNRPKITKRCEQIYGSNFFPNIKFNAKPVMYLDENKTKCYFTNILEKDDIYNTESGKTRRYSFPDFERITTEEIEKLVANYNCKIYHLYAKPGSVILYRLLPNLVDEVNDDFNKTEE